jgi:hypothetical protein
MQDRAEAIVPGTPAGVVELPREAGAELEGLGRSCSAARSS